MLYPAELRAPGRAIAAAMRAVQVTLPGRWLCSFLLVALLSGAGARAADEPAVVAVAGHDASVAAAGRRAPGPACRHPCAAAGRWCRDPAAVLALDGLIGTAGLSLPPAPWPLDRHGRLRVQVHADAGAWLQGELVRRGLALVAPAPDVPEPVLAALLALERAARATGQGLWAARRQRTLAGGAGRRGAGWVRAGAWPSPARSRGRRISSISTSATTGARFHGPGRSSAGGPLRQGGPRSQGARGAERRGPRAPVRDQRPDDRPDASPQIETLE